MAASDEKSSEKATGKTVTDKTTGTTNEAKKAKRSGDPSKRAAAEGAGGRPAKKDRPKAQKIGNPSWFVPVMLGLMLVGLVWVVTFYITQEQYPVTSWGRWNLGVGFGLMMAGFAMTTRWK